MVLENINKILNKTREGWSKLDKNKRIMITVIAAVLLFVVILSIILLNSTDYAVLYTKLDPKDAGDILSKLADDKIDAKAKGNDTILVPAKEVDKLRMQLASEGYPKSNVSLDIFEKSSGFGTTQQDKEVYKQYQLQEDLQNAIKTFNGVSDARVYLTIPDNSSVVLDSDKKNATASVLLTLKDGEKLSSENITAISQFVQRSVPGLTAEDVTIVDNKMNVLTADNSPETDVQDQYDLEAKVEDKLKQQINSLLQPIFGIGKVMSEVNVALDFDDSQTDSVKFEPADNSDSGIISSIDKIREQVAGNGAGSGAGVPGTDSNGGAPSYPVSNTGDSVYQKNSDKISYEVNTIKQHIQKEKGQIKNLSVSVIIDNRDAKADYTENVKNLVANAVGVSKDYITVENLPFNGTQSLTDSMSANNAMSKQQEKNKQMQFYILLGAGLLLISAAFLIIFKAFNKKNVVKTEDAFDEFIGDHPGIGAVQGAQNANKTIDSAKKELEEEDDTNYVKKESSSKKRIERFVENNPELIVNMIRSWLADD